MESFKCAYTEKWKKINNYENQYAVSNKGQVKNIIKDKLLSLNIHSTNCHVVNLWKKNKYKTFRVHRLVAIAFLKNHYNKKTVNHRDGNRLNNNVDNLEWNTHSENIKHSYDELNRTPPFLGKTGKRHHRSKAVALIENSVKIKEFESARQASLYYNLCETSVAKAAKNGCKAGGKNWIYV